MRVLKFLEQRFECPGVVVVSPALLLILRKRAGRFCVGVPDWCLQRFFEESSYAQAPLPLCLIYFEPRNESLYCHFLHGAAVRRSPVLLCDSIGVLCPWIGNTQYGLAFPVK